MKASLVAIARALRKYAALQAWAPDDYRILIELKPEWGRIHVVFLARDFPGQFVEDKMLSVINHLETEFHDQPTLLEAMNLTIRTFDQVEKGGLYRLSPDYEDIDDLLANRSSV